MNTSKQINVMVVLLLLLLLGVGIYTIWDPFRAEAEAERIQEDMAERAASTYARQCRQCHGDEGEGRLGPALNPEFRSRNTQLLQFAEESKRVENRSIVTNTLRCGRIGSYMPAWAQDQGGPLTDEQIRRLVILIVEPPENAWEHVAEFSHEQEEEGVELLPIEEVQRSSVITGASGYVCGQKPASTPAPDTGPIEIRSEWNVVATDNRFDVRGMGVPANQEVSVALRNQGQAVHNWAVQGVQGAAGREITTQLLPAGQQETIRFTVAAPGNYQYLCTVHPLEMRGTFRVE